MVMLTKPVRHSDIYQILIIHFDFYCCVLWEVFKILCFMCLLVAAEILSRQSSSWIQDVEEVEGDGSDCHRAGR